ncbi:uncharacterized protein LOC123005048 [Tribolium madens]|uniref:uncharacterized protein LOC123005048 n=1 Tax=Tribolium madens TaxID=41895 RepID=UPI001CF721CA|nr:uncharacterized protein LOC123005048 [Tribolium madens]XP_044254582.1 uncharacterized protein LOC123005048 [Tribolium madens]XP_044254583.1 uncharacterized protein LOC123005048 [Tribolium madens]XP_044254584.1 uncharacterized protein LOC123005048 [Tribolium madens]XP_044254585.1 uncharacterized protein LOC123005048 [Tribolium madens]
MQNRLLIRSLLLFLITTCFALALQSSTPNKNNVPNQQIARDKRLIFKKKSSPGFFRTLFSVVYEQWADTKNTVSNVSRLINDNFAPENAPLQVSTTTVSSDPNATTTEAPFKITRSEFNRILRRNLRGLVRLFNIELQDALKVSEKNWAEYQKNASLEISKFL